MDNSKTVRRNIAFLISDCRKYAVIDNQNVPDGVQRSSIQGMEGIPRNASPETIKAVAQSTLDEFKRRGMAYRGKNTDACPNNIMRLVVVLIDELIRARPDWAGHSDEDLLKAYQQMQRDCVPHIRLSPEDLACAKVLWAQQVSLGVSTGVAAHRREIDERDQKAKAFPVQGDYADALPNC
jgi:hypothetical protein